MRRDDAGLQGRSAVILKVRDRNAALPGGQIAQHSMLKKQRRGCSDFWGEFDLDAFNVN
jgi:hypothetical protein